MRKNKDIYFLPRFRKNRTDDDEAISRMMRRRTNKTKKKLKLIRYHPQKNKNNRSDKNDFVCENDLHILK